MARRGVHLDEKSIALVLDSYDDRAARFFYTLLFVILEPAGWFFFWEGLGKIFLVPNFRLSVLPKNGERRDWLFRLLALSTPQSGGCARINNRRRC